MVLKRLAEATGIPEEEIRALAANAAGYYRTYRIRKRSGGLRLIAEPVTKLKRVQRALVRVVLEPFPVSNCSMAYEAGDSVLRNAGQHRKARHLLHMDIQSFFPSVGERHFYALLAGTYPEEDIALLWQLAGFRGGLAVGAPSSPAIANRVMYGLDRRLNRAARRMKYTRYADDLIFSSRKKRIPEEFAGVVEELLRREGFSVNRQKTRFMGTGTRRRVTGVTLTDENRLSVGTPYKRGLRGELYQFLTKRKGDAQTLRGKLSWLRCVEPETYLRYRKKYGGKDTAGLFS